MKGDWFETVRKDKEEYDIKIDDDEITKMTKEKFKKLVEKAIKGKTIHYLNSIADSHLNQNNN